MNEVIVLCPAKVNLFLNILGKYGDMHNIKAINQSVDLFDFLTIKVNVTGKINITCNNPNVLTNNKNSVYLAALIMKQNYNIRFGFDINITKNIPLSSGLGGESTDAAGTILGIKELMNLRISDEELVYLGMQIGSDVPFCLIGGTCLVGGVGEQIYKIHMDKKPMVIVKPNFEISTKEAFKKYDLSCAKFYEFDNYIVGQNDFEIVAPSEIQAIKSYLMDKKAKTAFMTGSGPSVVGVFNSIQSQKKAYLALQKQFLEYKAYMVNPSEGIKVLDRKRLN